MSVIEARNEENRRKQEVQAREVKLGQIFESSGIDEINDLSPEGKRYVVLVFDGDLGTFSEADTLEELAKQVGDLLSEAWAFAGWYDLDEERPIPHGLTFQIEIRDVIHHGGIMM
jgi:hypothetical protein